LVIVATSDQHLGYENSDKTAFNSFLDQLQADASVTHFVLSIRFSRREREDLVSEPLP